MFTNTTASYGEFMHTLRLPLPSLYMEIEVECYIYGNLYGFYNIFPMVSPLLLVNCIYTIVNFFIKNHNRVMEHNI